ncbi:hypothetical protein ACUOCP_51770, partial [Escherichia sp. R-CC3]
MPNGLVVLNVSSGIGLSNLPFSRVKSMKDLSDSLKTLIGLEREAYSIENKAETKEITHNVMLVPTSDNVDVSSGIGLSNLPFSSG